jgi:hypothetical protein
VGTDRETEQEPTQAQVEDADAFEHVKQGSDAYDAQTYGMVLRILRLFLTKLFSEVVPHDCACQTK